MLDSTQDERWSEHSQGIVSTSELGILSWLSFEPMIDVLVDLQMQACRTLIAEEPQ